MIDHQNQTVHTQDDLYQTEKIKDLENRVLLLKQNEDKLKDQLECLSFRLLQAEFDCNFDIHNEQPETCEDDHPHVLNQACHQFNDIFTDFLSWESVQTSCSEFNLTNDTDILDKDQSETCTYDNPGSLEEQCRELDSIFANIHDTSEDDPKGLGLV